MQCSVANRNIVMNGDMAICQRPTSATGITASGYFSCDGWKFLDNTGATITMSQEQIYHQVKVLIIVNQNRCNNC